MDMEVVMGRVPPAAALEVIFPFDLLNNFRYSQLSITRILIFQRTLLY